MNDGIPDILLLPQRPILQTLASKSAWVRVEFFKEGFVTREEIYRTMELLAMMYNGWSKTELPESERLPLV